MPGTLEELARSMSHREYLTRVAALEEEWNEPNKTEHYLMQIAYFIVAANSKKKHKYEDFKLRFGKKTTNKPISMQESKQRWLAIQALGKRQQDGRKTLSQTNR